MFINLVALMMQEEKFLEVFKMAKEDYETLIRRIKLKEGEYGRHIFKEEEEKKEDKRDVRKSELREHIEGSYKSATKKEFYNRQNPADREKTFVGILAYGDKLKKSLYHLTDKDNGPKDVGDEKLLEEYKSCLTVYTNALGFTDDNPKKLMMVEKRLDRLGKSLLDMAEKGKLPTGYERDYLKVAENAIKSAQKVKYALNSKTYQKKRL